MALLRDSNSAGGRSSKGYYLKPYYQSRRNGQLYRAPVETKKNPEPQGQDLPCHKPQRSLQQKNCCLLLSALRQKSKVNLLAKFRCTSKQAKKVSGKPHRVECVEPQTGKPEGPARSFVKNGIDAGVQIALRQSCLDPEVCPNPDYAAMRVAASKLA